MIQGIFIFRSVPEALRKIASVLKCFWPVTSQHFLSLNVIDWTSCMFLYTAAFIVTFQAQLSSTSPGPLNEKNWTWSGSQRLVHPWAYGHVNDRNCTCQYYQGAQGLNNVHVIVRSEVLALMCLEHLQNHFNGGKRELPQTTCQAILIATRNVY